MTHALIDLGNPVADHPLNRGLVAWWLPLPNNSGGGTLFDLKKRYHGTLGASTASPAWRGDNLLFDGSNDTLALPNFSSEFSDEATVTFWMRRTLASPAGDPDSGFVTLDSAGAGGSTHYPYSDGAGYISIFRSSRVNGITLSSSVNRTLWHQFAVTSKNGGSYLVYQNGQQVASTSGAAVVLPSAPFFGVAPAVSVYFGGQIRSAKLHNRELSASEVFADYRESALGWPDTLRRFSRRAYLFGSGGAAPPAGNRRRRLLLGAA